jgi:3',5'-cyclic AMP phosphodiesterase CpdA
LRVIAHLSDLHFGRVDRAILPVLIATVIAAKPHLVVVSGDLTQRARDCEFREARQFLAALPDPQLVVPGNHDVPLYDVVARWLRPLTRFRRYISNDLEPCYADGEIAVLGINTARANTFKNGRINRRQVERISARLESCGKDVTRIVVTHHPFDPPQFTEGASLVGRASMAMAGFAHSRVDLVLSGHLHRSAAGDSVARYATSGRSVLLVQAGTATSTRRREELNSFNIIHIEGSRVSIDCMAWEGKRQSFAVSKSHEFRRAGEGWSRMTQDGVSAQT